MNSRYFKITGIAILFVVSGLFLIGFSSNTDDLRREMLIKVINFAINSGHYHPADINNDFSEKAFGLYIERIDFGKRFFIKSDVETLSKFKRDLDDEMKESTFKFFDQSVTILDKRIKEAEKYYQEILSQPFDFSVNETFEFDTEKLDFAVSQSALKDRWRQSLKYETLAYLIDLTEDQEKATEKSDTVTVKSFTQLEKESREKVMKRYDDLFHRLLKLDQDDRLNTYINSLVNVFDPHTEYFPPKDKENFDIRFSGQLEGIGAQLTQKNAYIEVNHIVPGSPSWKDGELEVGDLILKVAQGDEPFVDVVDMRLDEAVQLIRGKKGTKVRLSIKKIDGTAKELSLIRDVVILEDTYAKSVIIDDRPTGKKFGYIKLPSFYVDFGNANGRNCYEDVKIEIEKLKKEGISGIVFDLRDNGGGSLDDVVKIAGLFIKDGPMVQAVGSKGIKKTLKDTDPEIQYGGPLVVMVNSISASASEIFAAAIQDYNRGLVIGGNSTYGKGTVQNFTELDRMIPKKPADMNPLGSLKMTVQKFYRINGGATQLKGVVPDIVMPDYFNYMDYNESKADFAMPWDEIAPLVYNPWDLSFDKTYIEDISEKRIRNDSIFNLVEENGERMEKLRDSTLFSLNFDKFKAAIDKRELEGKKFERIGKDTLNMVVKILNADLPEVESDTSKKARTDAWILGLKKDVYLVEATNILKDIEYYQTQNAKKEEREE
jgi:carboxyl-terminal processing protease